jgi:hypothetical protein
VSEGNGVLSQLGSWIIFRGSRRGRLWGRLRGDLGGCEVDDVMMMIVMDGWKVAGVTPMSKGCSTPPVLVNCGWTGQRTT